MSENNFCTYRCPFCFRGCYLRSLSMNVRTILDWKLPLVAIFSVSVSHRTLLKDTTVIQGVESVQLDSLPENVTRSVIGYSNVMKRMWPGQQTFWGVAPGQQVFIFVRRDTHLRKKPEASSTKKPKLETAA